MGGFRWEGRGGGILDDGEGEAETVRYGGHARKFSGVRSREGEVIPLYASVVGADNDSVFHIGVFFYPAEGTWFGVLLLVS